MEQRKRIFIFLTFFVCTICLALLTSSLATHKWVVARPIRSIAFNASSYLFAEDRSTQDELPRKFRGEIHFGLFQGLFSWFLKLPPWLKLQLLQQDANLCFYFFSSSGTKVLNYGLGDRTTIIWRK